MNRPPTERHFDDTRAACASGRNSTPLAPDLVSRALMPSRKIIAGCTLFVIALAGMLIAWMDIVHSPVLDEVGHMAAGCLAIEFGRFDLYEVNPPLVKSVAAIPVVLAHPKYEWKRHRPAPGRRNEWDVGRDLIVANGTRSFWLFAIARMALLSIWMVGTYVVWKWAATVAGPAAGLAATILWSHSPEVMGWTATICPDSSAASIGVLCLWWIRQWLIDGRWTTTAIVGVFLGLALLAKTSWLLLLPLIPVFAITHSDCKGARGLFQCVLIEFLALLVINAGYGFDRSCQSIESFQFFSESLAGRNDDGTVRSRFLPQAGNRFRESRPGKIPVPLPASFVVGLDLQKYDFEQGMWSYLGGAHKHGGWWYWYIYALLVKTPVGTLLLFLIACVWSAWRVDWWRVWRWMDVGESIVAVQKASFREADTSSPKFGAEGAGLKESTAESEEPNKQRSPVLHESLILLAPAVCLFVLVSSQTGFSRYLRYVLPCYPFVFIWMSQIFSEKAGLPAWLRKVCWGLLAWSVISSLSVFPHSMSYFNELAGGPENGPPHLIDASIDWGQDVLFLADWTKEHPEAKPLFLSLHVFFDPRVAGIEYEHPPVDRRYAQQREYLTSNQIGPKPGWYSISVHQLYSRNKEFAYLFDFPKADMVGYSIYIYHLTQQDVDDWNRKHGFE